MTLSSASVPRTSLAASARRALAVCAGKAARRGARRVGSGIDTAIPGHVALSIDPAALSGLVAEIPRGAVLVTGSNGKGTTWRMLTQVMRAAGLHPLINQEGSGQRAGLATAMVAHSAPTGHLPADGQAIGLFEVDEGSLPQILPHIGRPRALVVTNIFRGQLDRYLEPAYIRVLLERAMQSLPAGTALVLNADDPRVACLAPDLSNPRIYFGIEDPEPGTGAADPTSDFPRCPRCDGELTYTCIYYAHLGHWKCDRCGLARPRPQISATKIDPVGPSSTLLQVVTPTADSVLEIRLQGLCNAYNALAAVAAADQCQLPEKSFSAIEQITADSLRIEKARVDDHDVYLAVATDPSGYTEVLRAVLGDRQPKRMLLGLDDLPGKQTDTSWIWDVDFASLTGLVPALVVSGNRAADLAVRLKYAGWLGAGPDPGIAVEPDPVHAFQVALARTPPGQAMWVVSTSAVLWQVRRWLRRQGYVKQPWREQGGPAQWPA
jgi:UDP-N-acetylmuramyl tripeptide synthase